MFLPDSKEQSHSWEADSRSVRQEIPSLLWNPKIQKRVPKSPALDPTLRQFNPLNNLTLY
jgi:hypothetical protein